MPWLKSGDNAATHPTLLAVDELSDADDRSLNEVKGFTQRLYETGAGHMTDYLVRYGLVKQMGNGRHEVLVAWAVEAGLMELVSGEGRSRVWKLLEDPEYVTMRRRAEVMFDRQRDRDRRNSDLTMPVRLRDGDACRYCGQVVSWTDHKTGRAGTYDHRDPGQPATIETYVVACKSCNSARQNDENADEHTPLRPVPTVPHFQTKTRQMLEAYFGPERVAQRLGEAAPDTARPHGAVRPEEGPQDATAGPARPEAVRPASGEPHAPESASGVPDRPGPSPDPNQNRDTPRIEGVDAGSGRVGSGLVGSGKAGTGLDGEGLDGSVGRSPTPRKRPRRRGRKGRKPPPGAEP